MGILPIVIRIRIKYFLIMSKHVGQVDITYQVVKPCRFLLTTLG